MARLKLMMPLAFVAVLCSCATPDRAQRVAPSLTTNPLIVKNFTGSPLRRVYLSPSGAPGWEENILGSTDLQDGDTLNINLGIESSNTSWDLRVEGIDGHYAEWKNLNLGGASRITLFLRLTSLPVAVAEIE